MNRLLGRLFVLRLLCCLAFASIFAGSTVAQAQTEPMRSPPPPPAAPSPADEAQRNGDENVASDFFSNLSAGKLTPADLPRRIVAVRSASPLTVEFVEPSELRELMAACTFAGLGLRIHPMMAMGARYTRESDTAPRKYSGYWNCSWRDKDFRVSGTFEITGGRIDKLIILPVGG